MIESQHHTEKEQSKEQHLSVNETSRVIESKEDPGVVRLSRQRESVIQQYKMWEKSWETFMQTRDQMWKWEYIRWEKTMLKELAQQKRAFWELYESYNMYVSWLIDDITTHYSQLIRKKDSWTASPSEVLTYKEWIHEAKALIDEYQELLSEMRILRDMSKALESRIYERKWQLVKEDPYKRYDKYEIERAKKLAKNWRERSWENAAKYFWWWPIDEKDAGKCGITDANIKNNKETMERAMKKMKERSESVEQKEISVSFEDGLQMPDFSTELTTLLEKYESIIDN